MYIGFPATTIKNYHWPWHIIISIHTLYTQKHYYSSIVSLLVLHEVRYYCSGSPPIWAWYFQLPDWTYRYYYYSLRYPFVIIIHH